MGGVFTKRSDFVNSFNFDSYDLLVLFVKTVNLVPYDQRLDLCGVWDNGERRAVVAFY